MDNLSHTVAGLAAGELIHRILRPEHDAQDQRQRRWLLLTSCWAASNFPDLDLVLTPLIPAPLGYLLHHRGHTHTLLYAIPQALLLAALIWLLWPAARRLLKASRTAQIGFIAALSGGLLFHLLMDYLNSYGIHPFHPFDSRWLYGDMVFIIEPLFWIIFGIPVAMSVQHPLARALLIALLIGIPFAFTFGSFLPWGSFAVLAIAAATLAWLQHRAGPRGIAALIAACCIGVGFVAMQKVASERARDIVLQALRDKDPTSRVLDTSLTSYPANPFCWTFVSVESNDKEDRFRLRRGTVSLLPSILPVTSCPAAFREHAIEIRADLAIAFHTEQQGSLAALRRLRKENCHVEAWLRFARAPWMTDKEVSDVRFASGSRENFTTMDYTAIAKLACPRHVPAWDFPRADLLGESDRRHGAHPASP